VTISLTGCATVVPSGSPPPCPQWSYAAIEQFYSAIKDGTRPDLEYAQGRQEIHCAQINVIRAQHRKAIK
jgi:hypothetical protein